MLGNETPHDSVSWNVVEAQELLLVRNDQMQTLKNLKCVAGETGIGPVGTNVP